MDRAGIEPAASAVRGRRSTPELPAQFSVIEELLNITTHSILKFNVST